MMDPKVYRVSKVHKEMWDPLDPKVMMDPKVYKVIQVHKVI